MGAGSGDTALGDLTGCSGHRWPQLRLCPPVCGCQQAPCTILGNASVSACQVSVYSALLCACAVVDFDQCFELQFYLGTDSSKYNYASFSVCKLYTSYLILA